MKQTGIQIIMVVHMKGTVHYEKSSLGKILCDTTNSQSENYHHKQS